jgi:phosphopantetheinyl transferase
VTESSVRPSSVSKATERACAGGQLSLQEQDLHLWRCPARMVASSDDFKRRVLSHYAPVAPREWCFEVGARGKPKLVGPDLPEQLQSLQFNLSHSRDWLVCAISGAASVGVDLEYCDSGRDTRKLAQRFFHPDEVTAIDAGDAAERGDRFYDYWTLKEARVKAKGEALALALDSNNFELSFAVQRGIGTITPRAPDSAETVQYLLWDLPAGFRLALCRIGDLALPPGLRLLELREEGVAAEFEASLRATSMQY